MMPHPKMPIVAIRMILVSRVFWWLGSNVLGASECRNCEAALTDPRFSSAPGNIINQTYSETPPLQQSEQ